MITEQLVRRLGLEIWNSDVIISSVSGERIPLVGRTTCDLEVGERLLPRWSMLIVSQLPGGASLLIGVDVIRALGGVILSPAVDSSLNIQFSPPGVVAAASGLQSGMLAVALEDKDFHAKFDGHRWEVAWKWKCEPPVLKNRVAQYAVSQDIRDAFDSELARWIDEAWLVPCDCPKGGIIPLLAVQQQTKNKVRPVLDFRELNQSVQSHTADSEVCPETLRRWRLMGDRLGLVDLKNAYLQLHVRRDLQDFQVVRIGDQYYRLTRLGFGLASAPRIMMAVVRHILASDSDIRAATDHYVDDIIVDTDLVSVNRVVEHLRKYGLVAKPPETLDGARVLGLLLCDDGQGRMTWMRSKSLPLLSDNQPLTRRELFSICGCLVGHYPVAGWLRLACSFIKRHSEGQRWEDQVGSQVTKWLIQVLRRVNQSDPVRGSWAVPNLDEGCVWCDASSLATGVALQIGDVIVEDNAWLRKKHDAAHINVAELDSVVHGLNVALRWKLKSVKVMTDSVTVRGWLLSVLTGSHRVKSHGLSEMLIKRRLSLVAELIQAYGLTVAVELVPSCNNKADVLTRVPKAWLQEVRQVEVCAAARFSLEQQHQRHHFGVERTLQLARQVDPTIGRSAVERVVRGCERCNSIDPAPVKWSKGHLHVDRCWGRVAIDTTHYGKDLYLTVIDCGPSRYTVWRRINTESSAVVAAVLEAVFAELGPPPEVLLDNSAAFRSAEVQQLFDKWAVRPRFRCAYRASGNGIVERVHRTVKRVAARSSISPLEAAFWYNLAPVDRNPDSAPSTVLFSSGYRWRNPSMQMPDAVPVAGGGSRFCVGDVVFVKPPLPRCTTQWPTGRITAILSEQAVEVDGIPRHVADCRSAPVETAHSVVSGSDDSDHSESDDNSVCGSFADEPSEEEPVRSSQGCWRGRLRQHVRPPDWFM